MPRRRIAARRRRARLLLAAAAAVASTASAPVARAFATPERGTGRRPAPRPRRMVESPRGGGGEPRRRDDDDDNYDDDVIIARHRSVGDAVRNLHGGKYQFSSAETQYLAGCSPTGREFAVSLYASSSSTTGGAGDVDDDAVVDEELPRWARRLRNPTSPGGPRSDGGGDWTFAGTLAFDRDSAMMRHVVTIRNEEMSWEAFYAFVLPHDEGGGGGGGPPSFEASPTRGVLAPRGGSSNLCDETSPYPDAADISIKWNGEGGGIGAVPERGPSLLVVGTEAKVWRYRLLIR
jgi:hypothetical protein